MCRIKIYLLYFVIERNLSLFSVVIHEHFIKIILMICDNHQASNQRPPLLFCGHNFLYFLPSLNEPTNDSLPIHCAKI